MRHVLTIILAASMLIMARPPEETTCSVSDDYYGELLLPCDHIQTVGTKIRYPGLYRDTMQSVGVGYLPRNRDGTYSFSEITQKPFALQSADIGSDDFYCWTEKNTRAGSIGARLGEMSFREHAVNHVDSRFERQRLGQGTIWFSPRRHTLLEGVSVDIGCRQSADSVFNYRSLYNEMDKRNNDLVSFKLRSLLTMDHGRHLLLGYDRMDSVAETINAHQYFDSTGRITSSNSEKQSSSRCTNQMTAGVISPGGHRLSVVLSYESSDSQRRYYVETHSGVCGVYVEGLTSKKVDYLKHSLRLGLYGLAGSMATVSDVEHVDLNHARYNVSRDYMEMLGIVRIPCIIDVNLFGSAIYGIINFTPEFYGRYYRRIYDEGIATVHSLQLTVRQLSIGLRGRIGEKLEFLLVPSLQSNIFVSGLEIRYLL